MINLKGVLPRDTLSHNFLINSNILSHNFYQKRTPCRIIFTVKGHPVERHIPSSQVWEYPPPPGDKVKNLPGVPKKNATDLKILTQGVSNLYLNNYLSLSLQSTKFKFIVRAKPELLALLQTATLQNCKQGIHATSLDFRQAHNLIKKLRQRDPLLVILEK